MFKTIWNHKTTIEINTLTFVLTSVGTSLALFALERMIRKAYEIEMEIELDKIQMQKANEILVK